MGHYTSSFKLDQAHRATTVRIAHCFLIAIVGISAGMAYLAFRRMSYSLPMFPLFATASVVILLGMAGIYYYVYQFYDDEIYRFIAIAWIGNAFYIAFEGLFTASASQDLHFALYTHVFSQITYIPFYLAAFTGRHGIKRIWRVFGELSLWFLWITASLLWGCWRTQVHSGRTDPYKIFVSSMVGGIPYAFWTLIIVGRSVKKRLDPEIHGTWQLILPGTFYAYAMLQPFYLLRLNPSTEKAVEGIFAIALFTKVLNSLSVIKIMLRDSFSLRERLEHKSVFEDLGALTASIEHDIKNPLQVSNNLIIAMKHRYQAQEEITGRLDEIQRQNQRIFAATEIIEILRGGRSYYERLMTKTSVGDVVNRSVRAVKVSMNVADDLYFRVDGEVVYAKAYQPLLQQAMVNVLKNSVEAIRQAKRSSGLITVSFGKDRSKAGMLQVQVVDNGSGVPEANLARIGHFFSTKTDKKANTGIGVFISRRILKLHGGSLEINSEEGEGTTVLLSLPSWEDDRSSRPDRSAT